MTRPVLLAAEICRLMLLAASPAFLSLCTGRKFMVDIHLTSRAVRFSTGRAILCLAAEQLAALLTTPSGGAGTAWIR